MATIFRAKEREFRENPGKIDPYRILSDVSITQKGLNSRNLNFDLRQLNPGEYSAPYHFHRYGEELFMILSGSVTLRTPDGLESVGPGDLLFFETGETGAHQLYNPTEEPCTYLDVRTFPGFDVCEYPDSNKILIAPTMETFSKDVPAGYFDNEENVREVWEKFLK